ncbi:MAG: thiamine diphosphokinase [Spirochaetaceae bacterium]|jgi:thiamine pyrophosphokinase|nr:thiamine diphosphokinase [Spirochaetaceae bacterium]
MRGIAFIGGEGPSAEKCRNIAEHADCIAAADSGLLLAEEAGFYPDIIAGDMDSLDDEERLLKYPAECIYRYPADKDFTDTELVVDLLQKKGCDEIILLGGGGGRIAHIFAIKALFERENSLAQWHTAHESMTVLKNRHECVFDVQKGCLISVFPLSKSPWKASSKNLKWELGPVHWGRDSFGISNIALENQVSITSLKGKFLIIAELCP